jgi:hypothetical protein
MDRIVVSGTKSKQKRNTSNTFRRMGFDPATFMALTLGRHMRDMSIQIEDDISSLS